MNNCDSHAATFAEDMNFLQGYVSMVRLVDDQGQGQVLVVPAMQGRVITSTVAGNQGFSFGWINRPLIVSRKPHKHINAYGGEDRFWLGPEGGQFSIFFKQGDPFDLNHWHTPPAIDIDPFDVVGTSQKSVRLKRRFQLENYSGTKFRLQVDREVRLLNDDVVAKALGRELGSRLRMVAFESENLLTNVGLQTWDKETGLLSIWILGMFNASGETTIVIPFQTGATETLGPIVKDTYFGKIPGHRLVVADGVIYFRGDAGHRGKLGLSPQRATPIMGSYDAAQQALTLVQYDKPPKAVDYVNSVWEMQEKPFSGDVINSYNDGPSAPDGKRLGTFYELESSSPAAALPPGQSVSHRHRTFHIQGPESELDPIAQAVLGASLAQIKAVFGRGEVATQSR